MGLLWILETTRFPTEGAQLITLTTLAATCSPAALMYWTGMPLLSRV
ncbi:hypothetical protein ACIBF6_26395 [Streptosporangium amethystogenes]